MQFSTNIDGFEQKDSQGFENSYNSYEQYPLEKFLIFTIYQNYTLALIGNYTSILKSRLLFSDSVTLNCVTFYFSSRVNFESGLLLA